MSALPRRRADYNEGHPATLPISGDLPLPEPVTFVDPAYFDSGADLNAGEVTHFKRDGFVVKRGLIDDPALFARVVDLIWAKVPHGLLRRDDQATWISPADDNWTEADSLKVDPGTGKRGAKRGGIIRTGSVGRNADGLVSVAGGLGAAARTFGFG